MSPSLSELSMRHVRGVARSDSLPGESTLFQVSVEIMGEVFSEIRDAQLQIVPGGPKGTLILEAVGLALNDDLVYDLKIAQSFQMEAVPEWVIVRYRCDGKPAFRRLRVIRLIGETDVNGPALPPEATIQPLASGTSSSLSFDEAYKDAVSHLIASVGREGDHSAFTFRVTEQKVLQTTIPIAGFPMLVVTVLAEDARASSQKGHPGA